MGNNKNHNKGREFMVNSKKINHKNEQKLISCNLSLYSTFYPKYYLLERTIKNELFALLREKLGADWFSRQMYASEKDSLFEEEIAFILRRKPKNFKLTDRGLLVESGFGFWVEFFSKRFYKKTKGIVLSIFSQLPPEIKRKEIYRKLIVVKNFRNKLFHYRVPIIKDSVQLIYLDELLIIENELSNLLIWLDIDNIQAFTDNSFNKKIEKIKKLIEARK